MMLVYDRTGKWMEGGGDGFVYFWDGVYEREACMHRWEGLARYWGGVITVYFPLLGGKVGGRACRMVRTRWVNDRRTYMTCFFGIKTLGSWRDDIAAFLVLVRVRLVYLQTLYYPKNSLR